MRNKSAKGGAVGASCVQQTSFLRTAVAAKVEYLRLRQGPRSTWRQRRRNIAEAKASGEILHDIMHCLISPDGEKVKWKAMNRLEAWKLNGMLLGTGWSWARCNPPGVFQ